MILKSTPLMYLPHNRQVQGVVIYCGGGIEGGHRIKVWNKHHGKHYRAVQTLYTLDNKPINNELTNIVVCKWEATLLDDTGYSYTTGVCEQHSIPPFHKQHCVVAAIMSQPIETWKAINNGKPYIEWDNDIIQPITTSICRVKNYYYGRSSSKMIIVNGLLVEFSSDNVTILSPHSKDFITTTCDPTTYIEENKKESIAALQQFIDDYRRWSNDT